MIQRDAYLQRLLQYKDKQLIKVVTGIRRCGKSTLLALFMERLAQGGTEPRQIHAINFEDVGSEALCDYRALHEHLRERLLPDRMNYIFLDEVQNVPDFQKAVDSLYLQKNVDLYLTGSNAYLLSGELATRLSGRYVEIEMLPLSFAEYMSAQDSSGDLARHYRDYLTNSSFPYTLELSHEPALVRGYLDGVYSSVVLKDVVARSNVSNVPALERLIRFLFDNVGNLCSVRKISGALSAGGATIAPQTVENYLAALCNSFIFYKTTRFDAKGKAHLQTGEKYYGVDMGLRYYLLGSRDADVGRMLENVIYLELRRRNAEIYIGKVGAAEVDFVDVRSGNLTYYQVAATVREPATLARELAPLHALRDSYPKLLLTLDDDPPANHNGVRQLNALDWLLGKDEL